MIIKKALGISPNTKIREGTHQLNHQNWISIDSVRVSFDIHHDRTAVHLHYFVKEDQVRAVNTEINSSVWEDSCWEFFISFKGDEKHFYNFEINAIGTVLGGYGKDRNHRTWLPIPILSQIETNSSLGTEPFDSIDKTTQWDLRVKIPVSTFCFSKIEDLSGMEATGNFYKCGDKLTQPHFLSWNPVLTPEPDFHRPEYFGELVFD